MLQRLFVFALLACLAAPAISLAQFKQGDWDLTLSGSGANDKDFRTFAASIQPGIGYFVTDQLSIGARPGVVITDGGSDYRWDLPLYADFHFDLGKFVPFVGANIGYFVAGGSQSDSWVAGPELGVKYFMNGSTYVFGIMSYQFNLNEGFDEGGFFYGLGLGVRL